MECASSQIEDLVCSMLHRLFMELNPSFIGAQLTWVHVEGDKDSGNCILILSLKLVVSKNCLSRVVSQHRRGESKLL